jgi:hypothetical protein
MDDRCGTSYMDRIKAGQTFAIIKAHCLFLPYIAAHEMGHILGAGHESRHGRESKLTAKVDSKSEQKKQTVNSMPAKFQS